MRGNCGEVGRVQVLWMVADRVVAMWTFGKDMYFATDTREACDVGRFKIVILQKIGSPIFCE